MARSKNPNSKKHHEPNNKDSKTQVEIPGERRWWSRVLKITAAIGAVGVAGWLSLLLAYKHNGAEELRSTVYRPIYSELQGMKAALQQDSMVVFIPSSTVEALKKSGDFYRLPSDLQSRIAAIYDEGRSCEGNLDSVEAVQRTSSAEIERLRTEADDAKWVHNTLTRLQAEVDKKPGESNLRSFTLRHVGSSPALDIRDPLHPKVSAPGTIYWAHGDWARFPDSVSAVDAIWSPDQFLDLDEKRESWQFRITREDLKRNGLTLRSFLEPIYRALRNVEDPSATQQHREATVRDIDALEIEIRSRIEDPKRFADLFH